VAVGKSDTFHDIGAMPYLRLRPSRNAISLPRMRNNSAEPIGYRPLTIVTPLEVIREDQEED
jgi:hypothetical protein